MELRSAFFAVFFAAAAFSTPAEAAVHLIVATPQACPHGTVLGVRAYTWRGGKLVQRGWHCQSFDGN